MSRSTSAPAIERIGERLSAITTFLRAPFEGIHPIVLVVFGISTAFSIFFFGQSDLWHTVTSSYAFYHGHFGDFYDFNEATIGGALYLPALYIIFAIWMSPLALLGLVNPRTNSVIELTAVEQLWAKTLLLLVFFATFYLIAGISRRAFPEESRVQLAVRSAYLLSPLAGFAVFTFGQYDIFSVLFTLLGVLMYFRRNSFWFVFWFSIAISFKYFAAFLFVPLALFYFKKPLRIALAFAGGVAFTALELLVFFPSPSFRSGAFLLAEGKASDPLHNQLQVLMGVLFLVLCVAAFLYGRRRDDLTKPLIFIWLAAYPIMLLAVTWHPQWTVLLAPAFALAVGLMRRPALFLVAESITFFAFIVVVVTRWPENVDAIMITRGVLSRLVNDPPLLQRDVGALAIEPYSGVLVTVMFILPLIWLAFERASGASQTEFRSPALSVWILRAATVLVSFTLPSLVLTFIPKDAALEINPSAIQYGAIAVGPPDGVRTATAADEFVQEFVAAGDGLTGLRIPTATYMRSNQGTIEVSVKDDDDSVVAREVIDSSTLASDGAIYVAFSPQSSSGGQEYTLEISQSADSAADVVGFWTVVDTDPALPVLTVSGDLVEEQVALTYYLAAG